MRSLAYPRWWNLVTGGLEAQAAALIAPPTARVGGLTLGAAICAAAVATVFRLKDHGRVAPGAVLTLLSALDLARLASWGADAGGRRDAWRGEAPTSGEPIFSEGSTGNGLGPP
jgi:hypothetical protein